MLIWRSRWRIELPEKYEICSDYISRKQKQMNVSVIF